jgi:DnaJ-class molecular chaperone
MKSAACTCRNPGVLGHETSCPDYPYRTKPVCPNCHGTGVTRFGVCTYCNGTGK